MESALSMKLIENEVIDIAPDYSQSYHSMHAIEWNAQPLAIGTIGLFDLLNK